MLEKTTKLNIEGKCKVDGKDVKGFRAIIDMDDPEFEPKFHHWEIDKAACKEHRKTVRADQNAFEDYAYDEQDKLKAVK